MCRSVCRTRWLSVFILAFCALTLGCPNGTFPTIDGGNGGGGQTFWVRLQAIGSTHSATTRCLVNGKVVAEGDYHGSTYSTGPASSGYQHTNKYPLGTELSIEVTSGYLNMGSEIFIWNEYNQVVIYNANRDGYGEDWGITYTI